MTLFDLKSLGELKEALFLERVNRFLLKGYINNKEVSIHLADTGRLEEILTPNRKLLLIKNRPSLKSEYTLIAALMDNKWVLVNSKLHSKIGEAVIKNYLFKDLQTIQKEVVFNKSRIDYLIDNKIYIELKGCTLVKDNRCLFPNAPTIRGTKHLKELIELIENGYKSYILFLATRECNFLSIYKEKDPLFFNTFKEALQKGVKYKGVLIYIDELFRVRFKRELPLKLT